MLSARGAELDRVRGLELGADDYVTKPFSLMELLARVGALLRRGKHQVDPSWAQDGIVRVGPDVEINLRQRVVRRGGRPVMLAPKQFDLLVALAARQGEVLSRGDILKEVWGYRHEVVSRTVDTHILELRKKLEADAADPQLIITVRRTGYRLAMGSGAEAHLPNVRMASESRSA